jgi:hypothetical protein
LTRIDCFAQKATGLFWHFFGRVSQNPVLKRVSGQDLRFSGFKTGLFKPVWMAVHEHFRPAGGGWNW